MSSLKSVAIVGRPNVGKSTLFNVLTRTRQALVRNQPGVTRDILVGTADWWGKKFDVVDTGGLSEGKEGLTPEIRQSVLRVLPTFDLLILVMDGSVGLMLEDRDVLRVVRESGLPFMIAVNKVDQNHGVDEILSDFFVLGEELLSTSFERQENVDRLVEWVLENLKEEAHVPFLGVRLSLVGQPNVGKSSLCNTLLGEERMLVSEKAGTTVDPVEAYCCMRGGNYILVDTAGLRRSFKRSDGIERISAHFSKEAVRRSDIVLLLVDAVKGPSGQDAKLVEYMVEQRKAFILVANKVDKVSSRQWFRDRVKKQFHFFPDIPVVFTCALSGAGVEDLLDRVKVVKSKLDTRIPTSQLNEFFYKVIRQTPSPSDKGVRIKFYYLTQTKQKPPSFIAFANRPSGVTHSYRRFLIKKIQTQWDLKGIPIGLFVRSS